MKKPIFSIQKLSFSNKDAKIISINKFDLYRGAVYLFNSLFQQPSSEFGMV